MTPVENKRAFARAAHVLVMKSKLDETDIDNVIRALEKVIADATGTRCSLNIHHTFRTNTS